MDSNSNMSFFFLCSLLLHLQMCHSYSGDIALSPQPESNTQEHEMELEIRPYKGVYAAEISVGTPPVRLTAVIDTGSGFTWFQCDPCQNCVRTTSPLFIANQSTSYKNISCSSQTCKDIPGDTGCLKEGVCKFDITYGFMSFRSVGIVASESITFDSPTFRGVTVPNAVFGCQRYTRKKNLSSKETPGILGLGTGPLSLISQLGTKIEGKFSYCLVPQQFNSTSKLKFGSRGVVSGEGVVSTPIVDRYQNEQYYITLEGISVGGQRIDLNPITEGNAYLDTGSTLSSLPNDLYEKVKLALREQIIGQEPINDPGAGTYLCYDLTQDFQVPNITFHFRGADLVSQQMNTFMTGDEEGKVVCLTMESAKTETAIIGNTAQGNYLVGYDLQAKKVSFKQTTNCNNQ